MNVAWLESFLALIEHGSFTRAAEVQHLSQPAFSRRIRALELWFGAELVDRSTFPVALIPAGVRVRASATETVFGLDTARDEIRGRQRTPRDAVRVSITHTLAMTFFAGWWAQLGDRGTTPCLLLPSNTFDAYDALIHGGCDLLLTYADPSHPLSVPNADVEWIVVATDRLAPYSSVSGQRPDFQLPGTVSSPVPLVTHGQGAFLGRVTERVLSGRDLHLRPIVQSDLTAALAQLVFAGVGVGWLPELLAAPGIAAGTLQQVGDSSLSTQLEIRLHRRPSDRVSQKASAVWHSAAKLATAGS